MCFLRVLKKECFEKKLVSMGEGCAWGRGAHGGVVRMGEGCAWGRGAHGGVHMGEKANSCFVQRRTSM